ncbi:flagellar biosynthetic protein FliO [Aureimonas sp. AU4]|uniref:flagellar biosynthetic protein FliO n=1 Tax=Aureimonas sp. AU4 TaxID=1638163 RepID=UPI0007864928|nr:flagellar biosynthetic protein FliO [Aureimonas sp. AU4]
MREWLAGLVGDSLAPIVSVVVSAAIVILLALVIIGLAKRVFAGTGGMGGRSRAPRLAILDVSPVDPKRKLVLVRRDDTEHLLLIGGQNDLVVESGIQRVRTRPVDAPAAGRTEPDMPTEPRPPMPQRRVPPVKPQAAPPPVAPTARENVPSATRIVRSPAPVREEPVEPADLRTSPAAARALPQDALRERVGERPLPARAPSEARSDTAADTPVPALPAFLGVTTQRALPAARPPSAAPAQSTATVLAPQPPQAPAPAARPAPEAQSALPQPSDGTPTQATTSVQPVQPRSMATPTLPQGFPTPTPRSEQMNPRSEESVRSEDEDAASSRNSLAQAGPPVPVAEAAPAVEPVLPVAPPRQPAVFRAADVAATEGRDETEEAGATSERQPLSVRSFATTIQARRANPVQPVAAPAAAPAVAAVEHQPVTPVAAPPVAAARPQPAPVEAPHRPAEPAPADRELGEPAAPQAPAESASPARTLTLEEEMERLLHDFTLDVSDRR